MGGKPQLDAVVFGQILRCHGPCSVREIRRRSNDCKLQIPADRYGYHVLIHLLAQSHAGVVAVGDDILKSVVADDFDIDVRIVG